MIDQKRLKEIANHNDEHGRDSYVEDFLFKDELNELFYLARLGLWAKEHAIDALEIIATGRDTSCSVCNEGGICEHLLEHASDALANKP